MMTQPSPAPHGASLPLLTELRIDPALLERLRARDRQAWGQVLTEHGPRLLGYATRMLGERGRAEDVVQSALLGVIEGFDRYEGRTSLKSWLFRAVHFRALDDLRARKRYVSMPEEHPDEGRFTERGTWAEPIPTWRAEEELDARRRLDLVREEMDKLPHPYREILLLRETHGLKPAEIALTLDLTPGNTRIRLHRARQALRAAVARRME